MKNMKIALMTGLILALFLPGSLLAVEHDYATDVANQNAGPSPSVGQVTTSNVNGQANGTIVTRNAQGQVQAATDVLMNLNMGAQQTMDSGINNYVHQDEQINLDADSGVVKVLRTDQKINMNNFVTDLVQFRNATPRELRHVFRTICRKEGGNADVLQDKVKKEYFMQVVCPEFQLPYIRKAAQDLDVSWLKVADEGNCNLYYRAKFRPIREVNWISQYYRGPEGFFEIDDTNNALYYDDQLACEGLQKWGLSQIDIPPNQVLLEVAIYDVNTQNDAKIGLDWIAWKNGPGRNLFEFILSSQHSHSPDFTWEDLNGPHPVSGQSVDNDFRYIGIDAVATSEFIDFLTVKGKAREMTCTTLMIQSGQVAAASAVDTVVAINAYHPSSSSDDEQIVRNPNVADRGVTDLPEQHEGQNGIHKRFVNFVQAGNVGVNVAVLPYIGLESMELALSVGVSNVTGMDANGLPIIDNRSVDTRVRLRDGEPFVIGGLKKMTTVKRTAKVPFLGSIPVLGWIFGSETNTNRESDVVVVVKPKFLIGTESDLAIPTEMQTIIAQAKGEEKLEIPKSSWGFDQWLLDGEK